MLSSYFNYKTNKEDFKERIKNLLVSLENKKILIYGAGLSYVNLKNKYDFSKLNIVAIADKKFKEEHIVNGTLAIPPEQIFYQDYDVILITNESPTAIVNYLQKILKIKDKEIQTLFSEEIPNEGISFNYLKQFNFDERLKTLNKKLKGKSLVIYGAGIFFKAIQKYYDLSELNIVAISDNKFINHEEDEKYLGYKAIAPSEIKALKPDYVLVATKFYMNIIEELYKKLKGTNIKIKPLLRKDFITLLKEIWE